MSMPSAALHWQECQHLQHYYAGKKCQRLLLSYAERRLLNVFSSRRLARMNANVFIRHTLTEAERFQPPYVDRG